MTIPTDDLLREDIVVRLHNPFPIGASYDRRIMQEAADEIERLRRREPITDETLRGWLAEIIKCNCMAYKCSWPTCACFNIHILLTAMRRAAQSAQPNAKMREALVKAREFIKHTLLFEDDVVNTNGRAVLAEIDAAFSEAPPTGMQQHPNHEMTPSGDFIYKAQPTEAEADKFVNDFCRTRYAPTEPSDAQVGAAACAIFCTEPGRHEADWTYEINKRQGGNSFIYYNMARAALVAAAKAKP